MSFRLAALLGGVLLLPAAGHAATACDCQSVKHLDSLRPPSARRYDLRKPVAVPKREFAVRPGKDPAVCTVETAPQPAVRYDVKVDGRTLLIFLPERMKPKLRGQYADRMAHAAATLPPTVAKLVTEMVGYDTANPSDRCWTLTKHKTVVAGMTADGRGVVSVFPKAFKDESGAVFDRNLFHEVGHTITLAAWGVPSDGRWDPWRRAIAADHMAPSHYAEGPEDEDAADSTALYLLTRPNPNQHAQFRKRLPHRFALLDQLLPLAP